jgi:hypothetical protein
MEFGTLACQWIYQMHMDAHDSSDFEFKANGTLERNIATQRTEMRFNSNHFFNSFPSEDQIHMFELSLDVNTIS